MKGSEIYTVKNIANGESVIIGEYVVESDVANRKGEIYDKVEKFRKDNLDFFTCKRLARPFINETQNSDYMIGEKIDSHYINRLYFLYNITELLIKMKPEMFVSRNSQDRKAVQGQYVMAGEILPKLYEYHYMMQNWNVCDKISLIVDNICSLLLRGNKLMFFYPSKGDRPFSIQVCEVMEEKYNAIMDEIKNWQKKFNGYEQIIERNNILAKNMFSEKSPSDIYTKYHKQELEK